MTPTMELRWNRRPDGKPPTFWQTTLFGGGHGPRAIGYRLEQKWVRFEQAEDGGAGQGQIVEEWRPIPFASECLDAVPALKTEDQQFWPVYE